MLFVGLNQYPQRQNWLNGCLNDSNDWMSEINAVYGRLGQDIFYKTLFDKEATAANIKDGLRWLVKDLGAGDIASFFFSGHGSQIPSKDPNEIDGMSECICPYDIDWKNNMVTDKDFIEIFSTLNEDTMLLCFLDACHTGDALREFGNFETKVKDLPRFMAPPEYNEDTDVTPNSIMRELRIGGRYEKQKGILISGCGSNQTSADAFINGRYNGALTYFVLKVLKQEPGITYKNLISKVCIEIKAAGYTQIPELNCSEEAADWPFLGGPIAV